MAKLPEGRSTMTDEQMIGLTHRLVDTCIDCKGRIKELEERLEAATDDAKEAESYAEELEAKLAKAVDVIDWALICWDDHNKHGYRMQGDWVPDARTTLAELKGEK
jgi:hypothetical protein